MWGVFVFIVNVCSSTLFKFSNFPYGSNSFFEANLFVCVYVCVCVCVCVYVCMCVCRLIEGCPLAFMRSMAAESGSRVTSSHLTNLTRSLAQPLSVDCES